MKLFNCPECDGSMRKIDDNIYQCKDCLKCWYKDGDDFYEEEYFDEEDDGDMDEGCKACGCDLYPDCKESCPLFDNDN